jgi:hypothetical protein
VWSGNPVNPNPDVIQEFRVVTNSFSAEFGETSGAVMQSTTKSGTNEFHGSAFNFLRNDKLNAGDFYTHTRPIILRNQYGGTIGVPIVRNRTFFFYDMQFTKQRGTSAFNNLTVPSPAFREGDFSSLVVCGSPGSRHHPIPAGRARRQPLLQGRRFAVLRHLPRRTPMHRPTHVFMPRAVLAVMKPVGSRLKTAAVRHGETAFRVI